MAIDHKPDESERAPGGSAGEPAEESTEEEERAWQEALRRARTEFADENTDTTLDRPAPELLELPDDDASGPIAQPAALHASPAVPPPARRRRSSRPPEAVQPSQTMTVRRRRQTGRMDLIAPDQAGLPADLAPPDEPAARADASTASPTAATTAAPPMTSPAAPTAGSAVARVLGDATARSRERSREREALERVLAMAKPRSRATRPTPAVLPPPELPDDPDEPDEP